MDVTFSQHELNFIFTSSFHQTFVYIRLSLFQFVFFFFEKLAKSLWNSHFLSDRKQLFFTWDLLYTHFFHLFFNKNLFCFFSILSIKKQFLYQFGTPTQFRFIFILVWAQRLKLIMLTFILHSTLFFLIFECFFLSFHLTNLLSLTN